MRLDTIKFMHCTDGRPAERNTDDEERAKDVRTGTLG